MPNGILSECLGQKRFCQEMHFLKYTPKIKGLLAPANSPVSLGAMDRRDHWVNYARNRKNAYGLVGVASIVGEWTVAGSEAKISPPSTRSLTRKSAKISPNLTHASCPIGSPVILRAIIC